ncbi:hypothetical protein EDD69_10523 [Thermolongibacillus altinsuensis]|jgi:hypothetical protein|uniref:DUF5325 family protein n=1 Tax=Thermolongibacillus altinsuensis TaxID=575256 RepID=A0A4V2QAB0_9BACL|nr:DUF5325 family protein [Thermolongibacillus altinsuensis]TCL50227.1 hypothetical protein EDD69_10523 [Thermolongibacillus altinsuensis]GMB08605.1 hypothetical protein B1no1_13150 [Thermolongibacillus altinsuensis]
MKRFQPIFLIFSLLAVATMMGIGIFISERNIIGIIACIIAMFAVMGFGFATKKRMQQNER